MMGRDMLIDITRICMVSRPLKTDSIADGTLCYADSAGMGLDYVDPHICS